MSVLGVTLFGVGAVLIYAAIKNQDPRDVVRTALGQKALHTPAASPSGIPNPQGQPVTPGDRRKN